MVDSDDVSTEGLVEVLEDVTDDSGTQMSTMERLSDIGRRILNDYGLVSPFRVGSCPKIKTGKQKSSTITLAKFVDSL